MHGIFCGLSGKRTSYIVQPEGGCCAPALSFLYSGSVGKCPKYRAGPFGLGLGLGFEGYAPVLLCGLLYYLYVGSEVLEFPGITRFSFFFLSISLSEFIPVIQHFILSSTNAALIEAPFA